jgi:hypothetical protein
MAFLGALPRTFRGVPRCARAGIAGRGVTLARGDDSGWLGVATVAVCTAALLRGASPYWVKLVAALDFLPAVKGLIDTREGSCPAG